MQKIVFLALITIGCLLAAPAKAGTSNDAEIQKRLLGFWRSPRHEYEFKPNGKIYMCPVSPSTTTGEWTVKDGLFFWDREAYTIVTLTDKKFVYKLRNDKSGNVSFILNRITAKMVGQPYNRESVR
jgi:hypothetical protein